MTSTMTVPASTPWAGGRFDGRTGPPRLLFGRTFEDSGIERLLFPTTGRVLCIASAGDTPRALATVGREVIAVDINPAQIDETRRRLAGRPARHGAADRLLVLGRAALVPLGWRPARVAAFCQLDHPDEQRRAWNDLASRSVRTVVRAGLSPRMLRLAYGDTFASTVPPRFGDELLDRIGRRIESCANRDNPWLSLLLTGTWTAPEPPRPAAPVDLRTGDVADVLEHLPMGSLDGISLSNVLDGPDRSYADRLLAVAQRAGRPGAPIIVRSFLETHDIEARRLADADRSLLWGAITVHRATGATP